MDSDIIFQAQKDLMQIPGIGKSISMDLIQMGIYTKDDLTDINPEKLYEKLCRQTGIKVDPCVLYVFRCAHYYVNNTEHDPELLKWWNWKKTNEKNCEFPQRIEKR